MKVTDEMVAEFLAELGDSDEHPNRVKGGIQAVLDLIEVPRRPVRTVYRSLTEDGKLWSESTDPDDFRYPGKPPRKLTFQKLTEHTVSGGWEAWTP